jgi:putative copper export protein
METCALALARCCVLLPGLALFGSSCFSFYAAGEPLAAANIHRRIGLPMLAAFGAIAWILLLGRQMTCASGLPSVVVLGQISLDTGFGRALALIVVLSLALAALAAGGGARGPRLAISAALLVCLAMVGHVAGASGLSGEITRGAVTIHLLAAGVWLGGLPPFGRAMRRQGPEVAALLRRFGDITLISICAILCTGVGAGLFIVRLAGGRLGPAYLTTTLIKLGLVMALLSLAAVNRFRLTPLVARGGEPALKALRRTVLTEQGVGVAIIGAVAVLGQLDPVM